MAVAVALGPRGRAADPVGADIAAAEAELRDRVAERVREAGADAADVDIARDIKAATVEGQRSFVEAILTATAAGRPRIAV